MTAGPVDLTINFLSPVEVCALAGFCATFTHLLSPQPGDLVKQSLPFSYITLTAAVNDGKPHLVGLYTDITAGWVSGNFSLIANWTTSNTTNMITHQVQLVDQEPFTEVRHHAQCKQLLCSF